MKPAIYYALHKHYGSYRVIAVTSETKRSWRQGWHGRVADGDNMPTHGRLGDLQGRFDTADAAKGIIARIQRVEREATKERVPLHAQLRQIEIKQREMINEIIAEAPAS